MTRCFLFALTGLLCATGCGPKKDATTAVDKTSAAQNDNVALSKFEKQLVDAEISSWEPTSNSGAQFIYNTLSFNADGTWAADGVVKADFEEFPCTEKGIWKVGIEDNANAATVDWSVKSTDCIMREAGVSLRTHIDFSSGEYKISFR
jgi:hypothetical protein